MATVNLIAVSKKYDDCLILNNINLTIEKGEFVAVVGSSGSGKSTLLRLVAGLDTVSQGQILINNQCVNKTPPAMRNIAMVFQHYALYPHMTVFDNMAYGLKMRGMKKMDIRQRVESASELLQIKSLLDRKPSALSGGQRQRVAMGRAIVRNPALFLFDEPLSNLDAKLRTDMRHEIKKLHQQLRTTCLYVTHDQVEAMTLADKIMVLNGGNIEQIATPFEIYNKPSTLFVASFMGNHPMNLFPGKIDSAQQKLITTIGLSLPLAPFNLPASASEDIMIGIRPEHIKIATKDSPAAIQTQIEFIDDMGADKLVQVKTRCGNLTFLVRLHEDILIHEGTLSLELMNSKINIYSQSTGVRIGGWNERECAGSTTN